MKDLGQECEGSGCIATMKLPSLAPVGKDYYGPELGLLYVAAYSFMCQNEA